MANITRTFYKNHYQLLEWQDELEFLCYILCEIVCPNEIGCKGFECHQAADLPCFIDIIGRCCDQETDELRRFLTYDEARELKTLLKKTKTVRNAAAHHMYLGQKSMKSKRAAVRKVTSKLESLIESAASSQNINQVVFLKLWPRRLLRRLRTL